MDNPRVKAFLKELFLDYWSIHELRFTQRCKELGRDENKALKYLLENQFIIKIECSNGTHYQTNYYGKKTKEEN